MTFKEIEKNLGSQISNWGFDTWIDIFSKYGQEISDDEILSVLPEIRSQEVVNLIKSSFIEKNTKSVQNRIKEIINTFSKDTNTTTYKEFVDRLSVFINSKSAVESICGWTALLMVVSDYPVSEYLDDIKLSFDRFMKTIHQDIVFGSFTLACLLLDILYLFSEIYYKRVGKDILIHDDRLNLLLEKLNKESEKVYPFLDKDRLSEFPDITPDDVGVTDITKGE